MDRWLTGPRVGPAVLVITGVGGVGKSALARRWIQLTHHRYPDGQLFAHLGAFDPAGPAKPVELLGQALRSLGLDPNRIPPGTAERSTLFRSLTADRKLVLLLDDAVSAAQVRPLLPASADCTVVVTTRWLLSGLVNDGARFVPVEPLPEPSAEEFLARLVGQDRTSTEPAATAALVRLCAGLPIALSVIGARLAARPRWSVNHAVRTLEEDHQRLQRLGLREEISVQDVFDLSYRALPAPAARCYRTMGLHPGGEFGAAVIATALRLGEPETDDLLDTLREASLLDETAPDRYRMHDLVRLHARQHAEGDPEQAVLRRRIIEWYAAGVFVADRLLTPYRRRDEAVALTELSLDVVGLTDRDAALDWLERERSNLVAVIRRIAPDDPLLAWRIADAMWPLFHYRRHHQDRLVVDEIATRCAQRLGDPDREARMLRRWAFAHFDVAEFDRAGELFQRCLHLCEELGDRYGMASGAEGLGQVAFAQRRYPEAAAYFQRQLRLCQELGQQRRVGLALLNLGTTANEAAEPDRALAYLRDAMAVFQELTEIDPHGGARVRIELGRALGRLGESQPARRELTHALAEMGRLGSPRGQAQAQHRLGELSLAQRRFAEARDQLTEAVRLYRELGDTEVEEAERLATLIPPAEADPDRVP